MGKDKIRGVFVAFDKDSEKTHREKFSITIKGDYDKELEKFIKSVPFKNFSVKPDFDLPF